MVLSQILKLVDLMFSIICLEDFIYFTGTKRFRMEQKKLPHPSRQYLFFFSTPYIWHMGAILEVQANLFNQSVAGVKIYSLEPPRNKNQPRPRETEVDHAPFLLVITTSKQDVATRFVYHLS